MFWSLRSLVLFLAGIAWSSDASRIANVAVVPVTGDQTITSGQLSFITMKLSGDLMRSGAFTVLDRSRMDMILEEQGFQQSGACNSSECQVQLGQLLGVDYVVVGNLVRFGRKYAFHVDLVDVGTGKVLYFAEQSAVGELEDVFESLCLGTAFSLAKYSVQGSGMAKSRALQDDGMVFIPAGCFAMGAGSDPRIGLSFNAGKSGLVVQPVTDMPAWKAGVQAGDVVDEINGFPVKEVDKAVSLVGSFLESGLPIILELQRRHASGDWRRVYITIPAGQTFEHKVCLSSFVMDRYEVTNAQFRAVFGVNSHVEDGSCLQFDAHAKKWKQGALISAFLGEDMPVVCVDWEQAKAYCESSGKRLPTEAEWEYAARGGSLTEWSCGNDESCLAAVAWYHDNSDGMIHAVGKKSSNSWGLYDMSGNALEWTADWYRPDYEADGWQNPVGATTGTSRVARGGAWSSDPVTLKMSQRMPYSPSVRTNNLGFRCVSK